MATISLISSHEQSVTKQDHYHSIEISTINSKIVGAIPEKAKITKVLLRVNTKVSSALPMCELDCYLGNTAGSNDASKNTHLGNKSKDLPTSAKDYDWDLTSYFNSAGHNTYPFTMNTSSKYIIPYWNNDYIFKFTISCKVDLIVEYSDPCTVTFKNWDGTVLKTEIVTYGATPTPPANPTRPSDEKYSYAFKGWDKAVQAIYANTTYTAEYTSSLRYYNVSTAVTPANSGTVSGGGSYTYGSTATLKATPNTGYKFVKWSDGNTSATRTVTVTGTATYTATFEKLKYTVTWKNDDGTVLETDNNVEYGTTPTYNGATPTKASTAQHAYTFSGWSPAISAVTGNVTYTAQFTSTVRKYTVKWYNYDGTLLETDTDVPYGTKPTYNGATPTKPSDDYYNYGFAGWSPSINEGIQGDKNFTAQFAQTDRYYTVRWVNASAEQGVEGALLETDEVKFNTQPDYNGATPKHPKQDTDPALNYDFIGWSAKVTDPAKPDTELEKVKGDITYTAIYETTPKLYAITIILFNSQSTDIYEYGTEITIESPEIVDFHRFVKWTDGDTRPSRTVQVTGEATYQAEYERIPIPIKANLEQVTGCYIIPTTKTIVYVISGTVPTVKIDMETVNGWSFLVSNEIPENGYQLEKLFITDQSGITTRAY